MDRATRRTRVRRDLATQSSNGRPPLRRILIRGFALARAGNQRCVAENLVDLAVKLAGERFDENVAALIEEARSDETELALAAAQVSTEPPMQAGSIDQIAYSLLVEAFQRASRSREGSSSLDDVA